MEFLRKDAGKILGMRGSQIQLYADRGILVPDHDPKQGKGFGRRYSERNLVELLIIRELGKRGVTLETIKMIMKFLRRNTVSRHNLDPLKTDLAKQNHFIIVFDHDDPKNIKMGYRWKLKDRIIKLDFEKYHSAIVLDVGSMWSDVAKKVR